MMKKFLWVISIALIVYYFNDLNAYFNNAQEDTKNDRSKLIQDKELTVAMNKILVKQEIIEDPIPQEQDMNEEGSRAPAGYKEDSYAQILENQGNKFRNEMNEEEKRDVILSLTNEIVNDEQIIEALKLQNDFDTAATIEEKLDLKRKQLEYYTSLSE